MEAMIVDSSQYCNIERSQGDRLGVILILQLIYLGYSRYLMDERQALIFIMSYVVFWGVVGSISKLKSIYRAIPLLIWIILESIFIKLDFVLIGLTAISLGLIIKSDIYSLSSVFHSVRIQTWRIRLVSALYFLSLCWIYISITLILTEGLGPNSGRGVQAVFLLTFMVLLGLSWLIKRWRVSSFETISDQSILYLRPFDRDGEILNNDGGSFDIIGHIFNISSRIRNVSIRTLERCVWSAFKTQYRINAIAKPSSHSQLIKSSTYHTDNAWQDAIEGFLGSSRFVICMLDVTNGYAWEMTAIRNHQAIGKTVFVFPLNINLDQKNDLLEILCHILGIKTVTIASDNVSAFRFTSSEEIICYQSDCHSGYFSTMGILKMAINDLEESEQRPILTERLEPVRELKNLLVNLMKSHPRTNGLYYRSWLATISGDLRWILKLKRLLYRNLSFDQFREYRAKDFFWLRTPEVNRVSTSEVIIEGRVINQDEDRLHAYMISDQYLHIQHNSEYYKIAIKDIADNMDQISDIPSEVIDPLKLDQELIKAIHMNLRGEYYFFRGWTYYDLKDITTQYILNFSVYGVLIAIIALCLGNYIGAVLGLFFYVPVFMSCACVLWTFRDWQSSWARTLRTGLCFSSIYISIIPIQGFVLGDNRMGIQENLMMASFFLVFGLILSPILSRLIAKQMS